MGLTIDAELLQHMEHMELQALADDFYGAEIANRRSPKQVALEQISKLRKNPDQAFAFDKICEAINGQGGQKLFFVEGAGGCGIYFHFFYQII